MMKQETMVSEVLITFPLFMHKVFHDFKADTGSLELNKTQLKALMVIHMGNQPHMTQICHRMNMEKGSLTPVIDSLIEMELVERKRNPQDRRKVNLALTAKGHALVVRNLYQAHQHILTKLQQLPPGEIARFKRAMLDLHQITLKL